MRPFASTVPFYAAHREPYPPGFFSALAKRMDLTPADRLIDLGCGPGMLGIGFAPFVRDVVAVDPEPLMLEAARAAAGDLAIRFIESTTEALPVEIGRYKAVTIGRALHWMEPSPTLRVLDRLVEPGGTIAICSCRTATSVPTSWGAAYAALRRDWSTDKEIDRRYAVTPAEYFAGSRFRLADRLVVPFSQVITIERLVARLFSYSTLSPAALGPRKADLAHLAEDTLRRIEPSGHFLEPLEATAVLIA